MADARCPGQAGVAPCSRVKGLDASAGRRGGRGRVQSRGAAVRVARGLPWRLWCCAVHRMRAPCHAAASPVPPDGRLPRLSQPLVGSAPLRLGSRCSDVWRAAVAARADLRGDSRKRRVPHPKVHAESLGGGSFINFIVTMKSLQFALDQTISVPVGQCSQPKVWDNPTHSGMAWAKGASVPS